MLNHTFNVRLDAECVPDCVILLAEVCVIRNVLNREATDIASPLTRKPPCPSDTNDSRMRQSLRYRLLPRTLTPYTCRRQGTSTATRR